MKVVSNTSPLIYLMIYLTRIRQFSVLKELFGEILIPLAVYQEIRHGGAADQSTEEVEIAKKTGCLKIVEIMTTLPMTGERVSLGSGELATLTLAKELQADFVILDDLKARRLAINLGLPLIGTVGLLVLAHKKGILPHLKQALDELIQVGFWISQDVYESVL